MPLHNFTKIFLVLSAMFLVSCSQVRESAGVNRKSIDEFNAIENPPLVIPPDLDLVAASYTCKIISLLLISFNGLFSSRFALSLEGMIITVLFIVMRLKDANCVK